MSFFKNITSVFETTSQLAQEIYKTAVDGTSHAYHSVFNPLAVTMNKVDDAIDGAQKAASGAVYKHAVLPTVNASFKYAIDPVASRLPLNDKAMDAALPMSLAPLGLAMGASWSGNPTLTAITAVPAAIGASSALLILRKMVLDTDRAHSMDGPA